MKQKNHFAAKLFVLSFIVLGLFTACPHPSSPEKEDTQKTSSSSSGSSSSSSSSSNGGNSGNGNGNNQTNTSGKIETDYATIESKSNGIKFTFKRNFF